MAYDSVQPTRSTQAVHPGQDAHDDRKPDAREQAKPKRATKDRRDPPDPQPVLNDLGQVTGLAINIIA